MLRSCTADATFQEEEEEEEQEQEQEQVQVQVQEGEEAGDKQSGAWSGMGHKGASRKTRGRTKWRKVLSTNIDSRSDWGTEECRFHGIY